jgi:hypothetical protein
VQGKCNATLFSTQAVTYRHGCSRQTEQGMAGSEQAHIAWMYGSALQTATGWCIAVYQPLGTARKSPQFGEWGPRCRCQCQLNIYLKITTAIANQRNRVHALMCTLDALYGLPMRCQPPLQRVHQHGQHLHLLLRALCGAECGGVKNHCVGSGGGASHVG